MASHRYDIRRMRPVARPMTGFWATLTPTQQAAALAYRGDDHHGPVPYPAPFQALLDALRDASPSTGRQVPPHASLGE